MERRGGESGEEKKRKADYSLEVPELLLKLKTSEKGLSQEEAEERVYEFGFNELPGDRPLSALRLFFSQFYNPLVYILIIASLITLAFGAYVDSFIIFIAVMTNIILGFTQEHRASETIETIRNFIKPKAVVMRNNRQQEITSDQLVPGDIIAITAGDKVPADARLLEAKDLRTNEAILTGESLPEDKELGTLKEESILAERSNTVFMGTMVESGYGTAVVVATGERSEIGKVARIVQTTREERTPQQKQLIAFGNLIGKCVGIIAILVLIVGLARGVSFIEMFSTSIALAIAAIPEGLPAALTVILALGVQRILLKGGLVKRLVASETLGAVSIICTDKTGTLTQGKMRVSGIYTPKDRTVFENFEDFKKINKDSQRFEALTLKIAAFCSEAFIENPEDKFESWRLRGRPTEKAMVAAAEEAGISREKLLKEQPVIAKLIFDPKYKYSISLNKDGDSKVLYVLGAPDLVFEKSKTIYLDGQEKMLSSSDMEDLKKEYQRLASKGLRVLATAYKKTSEEKIYPIDGQVLVAGDRIITDLTFVSFIALHDPLRKDTKKAIELCREAGIKPIIITGDHKLTAKAIAEEIGLPSEDKNIVDGSDVADLSEARTNQKIEDVYIYARLEPHQKSEIIQSLQSRGEIVAMTGDGVNDAPALKKADIGVALGSGTEVAKETADLILIEDNFMAVVSAIYEGRSIIENVRKIFTYLISDSFAEVILIIFSLVIGWPLPLLASQIIWVNLLESGFINLSLAFEPEDKALIKNRPKSLQIPFINQDVKNLVLIIGIITNLLLLGLLIYLAKFTSTAIEHIRTMLFASLSVNSLLFVFSCKSLRRNIWQINIFSNLFLIFAWILAAAALIMAIYLPGLNLLLNTVPLNFSDWQLILVLGFVDILFIEIAKWWFVVRVKK